MVSSFPFVLLPQIKEQNEKNDLIEMQNKLSSSSINQIANLVENYSVNYNSLSAPLKTYKQQLNSNRKLITSYENEIKKLDYNISYISLNGIVESRENKFAIVLCNGVRYAIRSSLKPGTYFSGSVKSIEGLTYYSDPSGRQLSLGNYMPVKGESPEQKYQNILKKINSLKNEETTNLQTLKQEAINVLDKEIELRNEKITFHYYECGSNNLAKADYKTALSDFNIVNDVNPNYKDLTSKLILARNNYFYANAFEYSAENNLLKAYNIYFNLAYPDDFKDSKQLFIQTFENYIDETQMEATKKNDINIFLALYDTIESKIEFSKDEYLLNGILEKYRKDLNNFTLEYYNPDRVVSSYDIVPEGYYLTEGKGTKVDVPGFLISKNPFNYQLFKSYEITHNTKLNFAYSKSSPFSQLKIPSNNLKSVADWIGVELLTENDLVYLECDGWISLKEKEIFTNNSQGHASKNLYRNQKTEKEVTDYKNHYKVLIINLKNKELEDKIEVESSEISARQKSEMQQIKEFAYNSGEVIAPKRLFLIPKAAINLSSVSWKPPASISNPFPDTKIHAGFAGYQFDVLFGINFDDNKFIGSEIYHGLGINFSYYRSIKPTDKDVSFSDNPHEIEMFYNSLKLSEFNAELRYSNGYFIGVGYSSFNFRMTYQALGQQIISVDDNKKGSAFSLSIGIDGGWYELYVKTILSSGKDGPFAWDNKNLAGNILYGIKFGFPIRLIREEPVFY